MKFFPTQKLARLEKVLLERSSLVVWQWVRSLLRQAVLERFQLLLTPLPIPGLSVPAFLLTFS